MGGEEKNAHLYIWKAVFSICTLISTTRDKRNNEITKTGDVRKEHVMLCYVHVTSDENSSAVMC